MNNLPIGIFDSGVGGLTVATKINQLLPHEDIVYFGDSLNAPYGNKTNGQVQQLAVKVVKFLTKQPVKLVVPACNTVNAVAASFLKTSSPVPVVNLISPTVQDAARQTHGRIGLFATSTTLRSQVYQNLLRKHGTIASMTTSSCSALIPLIEQCEWSNLTWELDLALREFQEQRVDTLILACTHLPLIQGMIAMMLPQVTLIEPSQLVAATVKTWLVKHQLQTNRIGKGKITCYFSNRSNLHQVLSTTKINPEEVNVVCA